MKRKVKLFWSKIRRRIKLFRQYYGWHFPMFESLVAERNQFINLRSRAHREENKTEYAYFNGKVDLINDLIKQWELRKESKE